MNEKQLHNENVATADVVTRAEGGEPVFVTAVDRGFYLVARKPGDTFSMPRDRLYKEDGEPHNGKLPSWLVLASKGDIEREQRAVEADMASVLSSPRYERPNSPEAARATNLARASAEKAQEGPRQHDETPAEKAARLQAEEKAKVDQAERDRIAAEENANRNREASQDNARRGSPDARSTSEEIDRRDENARRVRELREEAAKLEAEGGRENKRKAQEKREEANKLEQSDIA